MGFTPRLALTRTNQFRVQNRYLFYNFSSKVNVKKSMPIRPSLRWVSRIVSTGDNRPSKVKRLRF